MGKIIKDQFSGQTIQGQTLPEKRTAKKKHLKIGRNPKGKELLVSGRVNLTKGLRSQPRGDEPKLESPRIMGFTGFGPKFFGVNTNDVMMYHL